MQQAGEGTVAKALQVLDIVSLHSRPVRLAELQGEVPFPKTTLYRLLQALTQAGMVRFDPTTQTYAPGLRLVQMAHRTWAQSSLAPIARTFLDTLAEEAGETVHLAQLDRGHVLYVDKRQARTPVRMMSEAGKTGPAYCTGVGKAMLAFLDADSLADTLNRQAYFRHTENTLDSRAAVEAELAEIRREGVAYDREEHEPGILCIAAPVLSDQGRVLGAVSVTTTKDRHDLDSLARFKPALCQCVDQIAMAAKNWSFPG